MCVCGAKLSQTTRAYVTKRVEDMKCHDSGRWVLFLSTQDRMNMRWWGCSLN